MKQLNQKLATGKAIITQGDKDPRSQQTKADYQLNQPKNLYTKKITIHDETIEPEISNSKYNNHASR